jgi:hypothetical protein
MTTGTQSQADLDKYLEDITVIKDTLLESEKRYVWEPWAFCAWGGLILLASVIHFLVDRRAGSSGLLLFLEIWLPVILIAGFIELITLLRSLRRQSLTIFTRSIVRLYLSLFGSLAALLVLLLLFYRLQALAWIPLVYLPGAAVLYFLLAQSGYTRLYLHAYLFVLLAVLLTVFPVERHLLVLLVGAGIGASMIIAGLMDLWEQKRQA